MREFTCAGCGVVAPAQARGRLPKWCSDCRPRRVPGRVQDRCKECGTTAGMDWWVGLGGTYDWYGTHCCRCEPCHRRRAREWSMRHNQNPATLERRRNAYRSQRKHTECVDCGQELTGKQQKRCAECARRARRVRTWKRRCPCGATFQTLTNKRKWCSPKCWARTGEPFGPPSPGLLTIPTKGSVNRRRCPCGAGFAPNSGTHLFCSEQCRPSYGVISDRIMGMYRAAFETGQVKQAHMWRHTLVDYLRDRDGANCQLCGEPIDFDVKSGPSGDDNGSSIDHIIPYSVSKNDDLTNLQLAHWRCNRAKGNRVLQPEQLRLVG